MDDNICRLCLASKRKGRKKFKNIFTSFESFSHKEIKLIDAILECTPIQINENDNLPKDICINCLEKLQNSYEFREVCLQSDIKLKLSLKEANQDLDKIVVKDLNAGEVEDKDDQETETVNKIKEEYHNWDYDDDESSIEEDKDEISKTNVPKTKIKGEKVVKNECSDNDNDDDKDTSVLYACSECDKNYISKKGYHRHLKQAHSLQFIKCLHCNRKFPNQAELDAHTEKYHTFRCKICLESFVSEVQIEKHYIVIHLSTYIKSEADEVAVEKTDSNLCDTCGKNFENKIDLAEHLASHDDNCVKDNDIKSDDLDLIKPRKTFKCNQCNKSFTSSPSLNIHLRIHTGERPFTCDVCDKSFKQKIHLSIHTRIHTGEKNYVCDLCPQTFATNSYLTKHKKKKHQGHAQVKSNNSGSSFKCHMCEKAFVSNPSLQNHLRTHSGERPFECELCSKAFKQKSHLLTHIKGHACDKRYVCPICSVSFITNVNLKRHVATHNQKVPKNAVSNRRVGGNRSPFTCNSCGKGFISKQEHSEHIRTHAGEYSFMCDTCGDLFKQSSQLRNHILTHAEIKAFSCSICSKEFASKWLLRTHLAVHTDDFPHECALCPKRFKWRVARWRHEMRHTGEKPYKCSICSKGFIEAGGLRRHLRVHTGERPFKCEICFKSFKVSSHLKTHMKIHKN